MKEKFVLMAGFALVVSLVWLAAIHTTPGKGLHRFMEKTVRGMLICMACHVLLLPFGIRLAQTPAAAIMAGYMGLPGIALCTFLSLWP